MSLQYSLFFTWVYISLATAKLEMEPWDNLLNEIESELDPDSRMVEFRHKFLISKITLINLGIL